MGGACPQPSEAVQNYEDRGCTIGDVEYAVLNEWSGGWESGSCRRNPGSIPAGGAEFAFVFRDLLLHLLSFATNKI